MTLKIYWLDITRKMGWSVLKDCMMFMALDMVIVFIDYR